MAHTIENADSLKTRDLLAEIIRVTVHGNQTVKFLTPPGEGNSVMNRVRMALTRSRQSMDRRGKKYIRFTLTQSIFPWTDHIAGKRFDCVVVGMVRSLSHEHQELLDDLIARKGVEL